MKKKRNMKKPENFSHVCCVALGKQPMKSELDIRKIPTNKVSTHFCFLPSTSGYVLYCVIFWCVCKCDSTFIYNSNTIWTRYNNNNILCEIIFLSRFRFYFLFLSIFFASFRGIFSEDWFILNLLQFRHTTTPNILQLQNGKHGRHIIMEFKLNLFFVSFHFPFWFHSCSVPVGLENKISM